MIFHLFLRTSGSEVSNWLAGPGSQCAAAPRGRKYDGCKYFGLSNMLTERELFIKLFTLTWKKQDWTNGKSVCL